MFANYMSGISSWQEIRLPFFRGVQKIEESYYELRWSAWQSA